MQKTRRREKNFRRIRKMVDIADKSNSVGSGRKIMKKNKNKTKHKNIQMQLMKHIQIHTTILMYVHICINKDINIYRFT